MILLDIEEYYLQIYYLEFYHIYQHQNVYLNIVMLPPQNPKFILGDDLLDKKEILLTHLLYFCIYIKCCN